MEITNTSHRNDTTTELSKPCQIPIQELLIPFPHQTKTKILKAASKKNTSLCNINDFIHIQIVDKDTTRITIPGGRFRNIPDKNKQSIIHIGWGQSNIFQCQNWQLQDGIKTPSWYVLTIKNGPTRKNKVTIHFALQNLQSQLMTIPSAMLDGSLLPKNTLMAYHQENKYCERISAAKTDMYNALHMNKKEYTNCFPYYKNTEKCAKKQEPHCRYAVGSIKTALQKPGILPDIEMNKPSIAYSNACFLPNNYTVCGNVTRIHDDPRTRREVTLAIVFLISIMIGALVAGIIEAQMKTYNDRINKRLEELESRFTLQLNQVENQVTELQVQQLELAKAIAKLSRITANIANRQQKFETYILAFNRQLLQQQIITTRRSIENRKLILSRNAHETRMAIREYNSRKLILQTLKTLQNIPSLRNDTVYRNQINKGIIYNTEIYRIIKTNQQNMTRWKEKHPLISNNQSQRLEQFDEMNKMLKKENTYLEDLKLLKELVTMTIKPIQHIEFTNSFEPIPFLGAGEGFGISGVIESIGNAGIKILDTGSNLVKDVVQTGANLISEPIKIVIIAISTVAGIIILFIMYKFIYKAEQQINEVNVITDISLHPHIWKGYEKGHKRNQLNQ